MQQLKRGLDHNGDDKDRTTTNGETLTLTLTLTLGRTTTNGEGRENMPCVGRGMIYIYIIYLLNI